MNDPARMTEQQLYRHIWSTGGLDQNRTDRLVERFAAAARFLVDQIEMDGWQWGDNFLREYVRCAFGAQFTNTISPYILELLFRRHPRFAKYKAGGTLL